MFTFVEMFSGIGGFRIGLSRSGWRCVWANDWDKWANKVYKIRFGEGELIARDINEVDAEEVPDHALLTAGFPCQAFSVAGKRKGFADTRGTLFYDIARVVEAKRPTLLLLENVKGLLSAQGGYCFWRIIQALDELGYWVEWQVLNSKHFGVPQNRERVFVVGHLGERGGREIFPIRESDGISNEESEGRQRVASCLDANYWKGARRQRTFVAKGVTLANTSRYRQGVSRTPLKQDNTSFALNSAGDQGVMLVGNIYPSGGEAGGVLDSRGIFSTMKRGKARIPPILDSVRIRRLTPVECERLQGFPDGWTEGLSDTQRYRVLGNAVTVNVVEYLGWRLKECLTS